MKQLLVLLLTIFLMQNAFSQDKKTFYFDEASFGFNQTNANYYTKNWIDSDILNQYGVNLGVYHIYFKSKMINLITGFEYNLLNHKLNFNYDNNAYITQKETDNSLHSMSVPLYLRLNVGDLKKLCFEVGPYFNVINLKQSKTTTLSKLKPSYTPSYYQPIEKNYNLTYFKTSSSFGWHFALGYKFNWSGRSVIGKITYKKVATHILNTMKTVDYIKLSIGLSINSKKESHPLLERKFSHTFYIGQPKGFFHNSNVAISGHYEFGFSKSEKNMKELKVSYVLYKYSSTSGWFTQLNGNSQTFILQYGGRHYFNKSKNKIRPYINGHIGVEVVNYESGRNRILPAFSGGIHLELDNRFNIGFDIEGLMPNAYFRLGYRFY